VNESETKCCAICGAWKPLDDFHRKRNAKDGRQGACKPCKLAQNRAWYRANTDQRAVTRRRWYRANHKRATASARRWYERNRKRKAETARRWRLENPQAVASRARRARERDPAKTRARNLLISAVRYGRLAKPDQCEDCRQSVPPQELHGHHEDYSKPLDVRWLCEPCHLRRHGKQRVGR